MIESLSFGGGVQSNAIAVLIEQEKLPRPDIVVIADTRYETEATWEYWEAHGKPLFDRLGIPAHRITRADLALTKDRIPPVMTYGGKMGADGNPTDIRRTIQIPAFHYNADGRQGKLQNFCSGNWKRDVVHSFLTKQYPDAKRICEWIGFSTDEIRRARRKKIGEGKWRIRFPLIEQRISRQQASDLVAAHGWPVPPRSSCYICPYRTNREWIDLRNNRPKEWEAAQRIEMELRRRDPRGDEFPITLHRSGKLLGEAPIDSASDQSALDFCDSGGCFT